MAKLLQTVVASVMTAAIIGAGTHWSETQADASMVWSHAQAWSSSHQRIAWLIALSVLGLNAVWWLVCAMGRRLEGVEIFAGELTLPSVTSALFTCLMISTGGVLSLYLAAHRSLWAFVPGALAAWLAARTISTARYRWEHFAGLR